LRRAIILESSGHLRAQMKKQVSQAVPCFHPSRRSRDLVALAPQDDGCVVARHDAAAAAAAERDSIPNTAAANFG
jgi:hypothetical protein